MISETARAGARVLAMVSELHARGHQLLRISPGMASSGMYWRVGISAERWIDPLTLVLVSGDVPAAHYTTGAGKRYFGWTDAGSATVAQLADLFEKRFPEVLEDAQGRDWTYVGWYLEMLGLARRGHFPVAYDDWHAPNPSNVLAFISVDGATGDAPGSFPLPPRRDPGSHPVSDPT